MSIVAEERVSTTVGGPSATGLSKGSIGNISVSLVNRTEALNELWSRMEENKKSRLFFVNAHCYNLSQKDRRYEDCLEQAEIVLNDGIGIQLGAKVFGIRFEENLNGTDFSPILLTESRDRGLTVFLLGAKPGIAERAAANLKDSIQGLSIVGTHHGYFEDSAAMVRMINAADPDILIVGMGVPQQEKWITEHFDALNARIVAGVGAFIDFAAGRVSRAPRWMRICRMEWMYRLMLEPGRMWRRYLVGNFKFFYYIIRNKWQAG